MTDNIEKDYDTLVEEMNSKIEQAIQLLKEAGQAADQAGIDTSNYDDWDDLRQALEEFTKPREKSWNNSNWCADGDDGWNGSSC